MKGLYARMNMCAHFVHSPTTRVVDVVITRTKHGLNWVDILDINKVLIPAFHSFIEVETSKISSINCGV